MTSGDAPEHLLSTEDLSNDFILSLSSCSVSFISTQLASKVSTLLISMDVFELLPVRDSCERRSWLSSWLILLDFRSFDSLTLLYAGYFYNNLTRGEDPKI